MLEVTADHQLAVFVAQKKARAVNRGEGGPRVMTRGLWSVSRHPNQ